VQHRVVLAVALVAGSLAAGRQGVAADARTEMAREHYLQGDAYYKLDKYPNALAEYEQAYIAKQDPSFLYNIAQCHRLMGNRVEAIRFYRRYLKDAPNAPNKDVAEKHIKDLEAALASSPEPAAIAPRPAHAAAVPALTPTPATATVPPSSPASSPASPPGSSPGATLALAAPPPPTSTDTRLGVGAADNVPPSSDDEHPIYTRWWFWTGVGAVVAGGVLILLLANRDPACPAGRNCQ